MYFQLLSLRVIALTAASIISAPRVRLDNGVFTGVQSGDVAKFLGIPFAKSTAGEFRLQLPELVDPYSGFYDATAFGPWCVPKALERPPVNDLPPETIEFLLQVQAFNPTGPTSEDCELLFGLTVNVIKPASVKAGAKLPVVVWIYGGSFEAGGTTGYNGSSIVSRSLELEEPVIYVSLNYRLTGFGFLASKEVKDAGLGNLGLRDQRLAFKWVQKYISAFGGDPTKVTLWGESAGAISISLHMVANDGDTEGLFRAAFAQSGSVLPVGGIENGQEAYDDIVNRTGCTGAEDTLSCLRTVDFDILKAAFDESAEFAWLPKADGSFLRDFPQRLVSQGKVANITLITGNCDDEGTSFGLRPKISTEAEFKALVLRNWLPTAPEEDIERLMDLYPADPTQGSPFDTGTANAITPQYKRSSAFQGDALFQAPRRFFLHERAGKQDMYTYNYNRQKSLPVLGSFHAADLVNVYGGGDMADYLIRFVATLDPNGNTGIYWPKWTLESRDMLVFSDDASAPLSLTRDTYRDEAIDFVSDVFFNNPL